MREARKIFMSLDLDDNGTVSASELQDGLESSKTLQRILAKVPPSSRKSFKELDVDCSGALEFSEFSAFIVEMLMEPQRALRT